MLLTSSVPSLLKKWKAVHDGVQDSEEAYQDICSSISEENKNDWLALESTCQTKRWTDKKVMDVYDVQADKSKPSIIIHRTHFDLYCRAQRRQYPIVFVSKRVH